MQIKILFRFRSLVATLVVLASLGFVFLAAKNPLGNGDIVGYTAVVLAQRHSDPSSLHTATWRELEHSLGNIQNLREGNSYARVVATDPIALQQQLPYYQPRVAYTFLTSVVATVGGVSIPTATAIASGIAISALFSTFYLALTRHYGPFMALAIVASLALCLHWPLLARASTPDALATFFALLALLCLRRGQVAVFSIPAVLLLLTRHDQAIFLMLIIWFSQHHSLRQKIAQAGLFLTVFAGLYFTTGWYGWRVLFMHTFAAPYPYPAQAAPSIPAVIEQYAAQWKALWLALRNTFESELPLVAAALGIAALPRLPLQDRALLQAALCSMAVKLLLFPAIAGSWSRLFMAEIVVIAFITLTATKAGEHTRAGQNPDHRRPAPLPITGRS